MVPYPLLNPLLRKVEQNIYSLLNPLLRKVEQNI